MKNDIYLVDAMAYIFRAFYSQGENLSPGGVPVNVILFPMEGDPRAADAFWHLAKRTRGAFFCPSRDWP